jgi:predicted permease
VGTRGPEYRDPARRSEFHLRVVERLEEIPGVTEAGAVQFMPLFPGFGQFPVTTGARDSVPGSEERAVYLRVTPGFFEAMAMPLLRGRGFDQRDSAGAAPVAVVSQSLARRLFGDGDPIGSMVSGGLVPSPREIVGVVGDVRSDRTSAEPGAILYVPLAQDGDTPSMSFALRAHVEPMTLLPEAERAVRLVDRMMPVYIPQTMRELLDSIDARRIALRSLLGVFAALGLALAVTGMFAVLSHSVSRRTRELGIRIALGATRRDVLADVLGGALLLAALGIAIGLSGILRSQLYGIEATDPTTYVALATLLGTLVLAASALPAMRAAAVDPIVALREQ